MLTSFLDLFGLTPADLGERAVASLVAFVGVIFTGAVGLLTWFGSNWMTRRNERRLREEKSRDIQAALLAEIDAIVRQWTMIPPDQTEAGANRRFDLARQRDENYTPYVTAETGAHVFTALISEISVLDRLQISAVVRFYRQIHMIEKFAEEMKSDRFYALDLDRKERMTLDYLRMIKTATRLGEKAKDTLRLALDPTKRRQARRAAALALLQEDTLPEDEKSPKLSASDRTEPDRSRRAPHDPADPAAAQPTS